MQYSLWYVVPNTMTVGDLVTEKMPVVSGIWIRVGGNDWAIVVVRMVGKYIRVCVCMCERVCM